MNNFIDKAKSVAMDISHLFKKGVRRGRQKIKKVGTNYVAYLSESSKRDDSEVRTKRPIDLRQESPTTPSFNKDPRIKLHRNGNKI